MKKYLRRIFENLILYKAILRYIAFLLKHINKKKCVFIATPTHRNLGDHAIVYAQYKFMRDIDKTTVFFEFSRREYEKSAGIIRFLTGKDTQIVIDGGGNLGTLWREEENKMRDIVLRFKKNRILMFPQTAYFEDSDYGKDELKKSMEVYDGHKNLLIMARDRQSYELLAENLKNTKVIYCPDIVFYVDDAECREFSCNRKDVLLCLREDKERVLSELQWSQLEEYFTKQQIIVKRTSTITNCSVHAPERTLKLKEKWKEFSGSKLVITDRLHGMIFSAITGTPCIALNNVSGKVQGGYAWIKALPYVTFCEDFQDLMALIPQYYGMEQQHYDRSILQKEFNLIEEIVLTTE